MSTKALFLATLLFMVVVGATLSFMSEHTLLDDNPGSALGNPMGFLLNYVNNVERTVKFRSEFTFDISQKLDFSLDKSIDSFYIDYRPDSKFIVDGLSLRSVDSNHIEFVDFIGDIQLADEITFRGSSKRVRADTHTFAKDRFVKVSGDDIEFTKVLLNKMGGQSMILNNVTGVVELEDNDSTVKITLNNKKFEISSFVGEIQYYEDHIIIDGIGRLRIDVFAAPSE